MALALSLSEIPVALRLLWLFVSGLRSSGRLGLIAFILASVGNVALAGVTMGAEMFEWPLVAANDGILGCMEGFRFQAAFADPTLSCASLPLGARNLWTIGAILGVSIGTGLLGVAIVRAKAPSRWAGVLIAIGWFYYLLSGALRIGFDGVAETIIGAGYVWCGWAMWNDRGETSTA